MTARCLLALAIGVALGATAGRSLAADPKAGETDLADLKAAVATADKRGENVGAIQEALTALEKALAKGTAAKPGEAPRELTALREAVEMTAKKGENVETIGKELGRVEKAVTGREYERPKVPEQQLEPVPPLPRVGGGRFGGGGGGGRFGGGGRIVIGGNAEGFNATSITASSNGTYVINARKGDVSYTITGQANGLKIVIKEGDKATETDDTKKVPEEHRSAVEALLKMVNK